MEAIFIYLVLFGLAFISGFAIGRGIGFNRGLEKGRLSVRGRFIARNIEIKRAAFLNGRRFAVDHKDTN